MMWKLFLMTTKWNFNNWSKQTLFWRLKSKKDPANIALFKVNNRNTRKMYKICSKLTIKTLERRLAGEYYFWFLIRKQ